jgi:hypothetical protein
MFHRFQLRLRGNSILTHGLEHHNDEESESKSCHSCAAKLVEYIFPLRQNMSHFATKYLLALEHALMLACKLPCIHCAEAKADSNAVDNHENCMPA